MLIVIMDCIFCKIIQGELPSYKVYEDERVLAFLDINPINPGHCMVIPKTHYENIFDAPEEVVVDLAKAVKKIAPGVSKAVGAKGFNLGVNNGVDAGQIVFHSHWHIMPRFPGDGHELWKGKEQYKENLFETAEKIRSCVE